MAAGQPVDFEVMFDLSPVKLLLIAVVALVVLGPDKLPQMARQIGATWADLRQWRQRLETEVRNTFPDLPPTDRITEVVRSPLGYLDRLADDHERQRQAGVDDTTPGSGPPGAPSPAEDPAGAAPAGGDGTAGAAGAPRGADPADDSPPGLGRPVGSRSISDPPPLGGVLNGARWAGDGGGEAAPDNMAAADLSKVRLPVPDDPSMN